MMTEIELIEQITILEKRFDKRLTETKEQEEEWARRFHYYHSEDFGRAVEYLVKNRTDLPRNPLSVIYGALSKVGAWIPGKTIQNPIPAHPFCSYIDEAGHTSVWWNSTGQAFGNDSPAENAPEEFDSGDGVARLFDVSGDDGHKVMKRWGIYREYRLGREAVLDEIVREVVSSGLDEGQVEARKKELLGEISE